MCMQQMPLFEFLFLFASRLQKRAASIDYLVSLLRAFDKQRAFTELYYRVLRNFD